MGTADAHEDAHDDAALAALLEERRYLRAYELAGGREALSRRRDVSGLVLMSRIARRVGDRRAGRRNIVRARRIDPTHPDVLWRHAAEVSDFRGPWDALLVLDAWTNERASVDALRQYRLLRAACYQRLHDFGRARTWIDLAHDVEPGHLHVDLARASLLIEEDRYDEALEAARRMHALATGVDALDTAAWLAHVLRLTSHDDEAQEILLHAARESEGWELSWELIDALWRRRDTTRMASALDRLELLTPNADAPLRAAIESMRFEVEYARGDLKSAAARARASRSSFLEAVAQRLEEPGRSRTAVQLDVPFIRQHERTCAPASLAMLAKFWNRPAEHLSIADEICYDGTPDASSRRWAETNGFAVREFQMTWQAACDLLDRGIPFALSTVEASSAHMQLVCGYDALRGSLFLRDPFIPSVLEMAADLGIERYSGTGPRGLALVPREMESKFTDLALPECALHDTYHRLQIALQEHRRADAQAQLDELIASSPDGRLTWLGRWSMTAYDRRSHETLPVLEALIERYPKHEPFLRAHIAVLRDLGRFDDAVVATRRAIAAGSADPVFLTILAESLVHDARNDETVLRLFRRAVRRAPSLPNALTGLGRALYATGDTARGLDALRLGAALNVRLESLSQLYDQYAFGGDRGDESLAFLRERFELLGAASPFPAISLAQALLLRNDVPGMNEVIAAAKERRPGDGDLALYAAGVATSFGRFDEATADLEVARGKVHETSLQRARAQLFLASGRLRDCADALRAWIAIDPLDVEAHAELVRLLPALEDEDSDRRHLAAFVERFPQHRGLRTLWLERLRARRGPDWLEAARAFAIEAPDNVWALREFAFASSDHGEFDVALREVDRALELDPLAAATHDARANVLLAMARVAEAHVAARRAFELDPDSVVSARLVMATATGAGADALAARWMFDQIEKTARTGAALTPCAVLSLGRVSDRDLLARLEQIATAHPHWAASHLALSETCLRTASIDRAVQAAERAVRAFPFDAHAWMAWGRARRASGDYDGEIHCIEKAAALAPRDVDVQTQLAFRYEDSGDARRSRETWDRLVSTCPSDPGVRSGSALEKLRRGDVSGAIADLERGVRAQPASRGIWQVFRTQCVATGMADKPRLVLAEISARRPHDADLKLVAADFESDPRERIARLEEAVRLEPHYLGAVDLLAETLANAGQFEAARKVCRASARRGVLDHAVRGRLAWIDWRAGEKDTAIRTVTAIVGEHPGYAWGWAQLAHWHFSREDIAAATSAAKSLIASEPGSSRGYLILCDLARHDRRPSDAVVALEQALRVNPDDGDTVCELLEVHLANHDAAAAASVLAHHRGGLMRTTAHAYDARVAIERDDRTAAADALRATARSLPREPQRLVAVCDAFESAKWTDTLRVELNALLDDPEADPEVGAIWVRTNAAPLDDALLNRIAGLPRDDMKRLAAAGLLAGCARSHLDTMFARADATVGEAVRGDELCWSFVMRAIADGVGAEASGCRAIAPAWMHDWRRRTLIDGQSLLLVAVALRAIGQVDDAREASARALELDPLAPAGAAHRAWLYTDAVLRSDFDAATSLREQIDVAAATPWYRTLVELVDVLQAFQRGLPGAARISASEARKRLVLGWTEAGVRRVDGDVMLGAICKNVWNLLGERSGDLVTRFAAFRARTSPGAWAVLYASVLVVVALILSIVVR